MSRAERSHEEALLVLPWKWSGSYVTGRGGVMKGDVLVAGITMAVT